MTKLVKMIRDRVWRDESEGEKNTRDFYSNKITKKFV